MNVRYKEVVLSHPKEIIPSIAANCHYTLQK